MDMNTHYTGIDRLILSYCGSFQIPSELPNSQITNLSCFDTVSYGNMLQQQQEAHTSLRVFIYWMEIAILGLPTLSGFGGDEISFSLILSPNVTPGQALYILCMPLSDFLADLWHTSIRSFGSLLYRLWETAPLTLGCLKGEAKQKTLY